MIPILDFQERSLKGTVMKSMEFDLSFSKKLRELVAERNLQFDAEQLIVDDAIADAVFDAGVKLLAEVGLYHLETQRVVQISEEEIRRVAQEYYNNPPTAVFGAGDDKLEVSYRVCDDKRSPILAGGVAGVIEQEWLDAFVQSFVQEPSNKALGIAGGISSVNGIQPKAGTLSEMECAQWECRKIKEVIDRCGRPGMHMGLLCTASTVGASMACMEPGVRESYNTQIGIHVIPEQKVDWTRFMLAKFCEDRGITPWTSCVSIMGGLSRNGPDVAVALIANLLGQLCYGHGSLANLFVNRMDGSWGDAECIWATSAACRASERNIRVPIASVIAPRMDLAATPDGVVHCGAIATALTGSGFNYAWIAGATGLEARILGEVMNSTAGMSREQTNELVKRILADVPDPAEGAVVCMTELTFADLYDIETVQPKEHYKKDIMAGVERLAAMGVGFS